MVHVGYNTIKIKQIKKFTVSIFQQQEHFFLVHVSRIKTQNFKKMFVDFNKKNLILIFISIKFNNFKHYSNIYLNS
jgi:hypothetical protein